jgi:hypothetical protein
MPITQILYVDLETNTIKEFIENTIPHHKRTLILIDLRDEYNKLMSD